MALHNLSSYNQDGPKKKSVSKLGVNSHDQNDILDSADTEGKKPRKFVKIENMSYEEQVEFAKESILNYLTMAPRTRKQLEDKLNDRGYSEEAIRTALDRMEEVGIVNDSEFAKLWVSARHNNAKLAPYAIKRELSLKGVAEDIIEKALEDIDEDSILERAKEIAEIKIRTVKGDRNAKIKKIASAIARKGYPSSVAFSVAKEVIENAGENTDDMFLDSGEE